MLTQEWSSNPEINAEVQRVIKSTWRTIKPVLQGNQPEALLYREIRLLGPKKSYFFSPMLHVVQPEIAQAAWQELKRQFETNLGVDWNNSEKLEPSPRRDENIDQFAYTTNLPNIILVKEFLYLLDRVIPEAETVFIRNLKPKSLRRKLGERLLVALRGKPTGNPQHFPKWD